MSTFELKLPDIGEGVVEGEIVRWLVKEGDVIRADQPMVEVMTDKATVEIPSPRAGRVVERAYKEGQICPVGKVLVRIDESAAAGASAAAPPGAPTPPAAPKSAAAVPAPAPATSSPSTRTPPAAEANAQVAA